MREHLPTVREALEQARQWGLARLDAQMLLLHALQRPLHERAWLLAHDRDALSAAQFAHWQQLCQRRLDAEPVAYLTGCKAFYGLDLQVDSRVLDPRDDTETLVDWALALFCAGRPWRMLDLGTGSGALALALQSQRPAACIWATDVSQDALAVARANAARLKLPLHFACGHWLQALAGQAAFDCIVSNPPYIRVGDAHLPALRHEPQLALTSGVDGLDALRAIIQAAPGHLRPGGWLLLEHGFDQAPDVAALLRGRGFASVQTRHDLANVPRCTGGQWPL